MITDYKLLVPIFRKDVHLSLRLQHILLKINLYEYTKLTSQDQTFALLTGYQEKKIAENADKEIDDLKLSINIINATRDILNT